MMFDDHKYHVISLILGKTGFYQGNLENGIGLSFSEDFLVYSLCYVNVNGLCHTIWSS